ncbi:hypothetical protein [Dichotomicrobium thermohalophilum]|uniref:Uncharacterized protein n=1 Tax=Dichotomicrobium thermohalophilum TaxID=933063 RepID=A0A397PF45_9HYPH|nr:hypothetical protein [Dichotomicrobium thermohalophilum]RIA47578.1 hypothetical protein BXY53_2133 [Dichotomicrobium thermohalophilum]
MTLADYARFALLIALGVLSFIVFLVAGTLVGLMFVDPYGCRCVYPFPPVGLYVLGILGLLLLIPMVRTAVVDAPEALERIGLTSNAAIATSIISVLVLIVVL